jgi:hypothetical protein
MPLGSLLFNFSLEPLLEAMKRDENIQGAYVRMKDELLVKATVEAYADHVVFVSESKDWIIQIF